MKSANLIGGQNISANEYDVRVHGQEIFCECGARVICVTPNNDEREPFFKTTGNGDSRHREGCSEIRNLYINNIEQAIRYVDTVEPVLDKELVMISFELGKKKALAGTGVGTIESDRQFKPNYINKPGHTEKKTHESIKTLKKVADLIKKNKPEELSKIAFKRYGTTIRFFDLVIDQNVAYEKTKKVDQSNQEYIIYGKVNSIVKTDKVMFINLDEQEGAKAFALVVFANKFEQFAFVNRKMEGMFVLAFGNVTPKRGYDGTQMILNDSKYLYELPE
jgi:hypothetical protein